jgi:hypothetical protein
MVQTVTGNLVELSSAMWIEIFNGVKDNMVFSVLFVIEVGLIPFYSINTAYERTKNGSLLGCYIINMMFFIKMLFFG